MRLHALGFAFNGMTLHRATRSAPRILCSEQETQPIGNAGTAQRVKGGPSCGSPLFSWPVGEANTHSRKLRSRYVVLPIRLGRLDDDSGDLLTIKSLMARNRFASTAARHGSWSPRNLPLGFYPASAVTYPHRKAIRTSLPKNSKRPKKLV